MKITNLVILFIIIVAVLLLLTNIPPSIQKYSANISEVPAISRLPPGPEREMVKEWIEGAKKEGQLVYVSNQITPETNEKLVEAFKNFTGIEIEIKHSQMKSGAIITLIEKELEVGKITYDVIHVSDIPWFLQLVERGELLKWSNPNEDLYISPAPGFKKHMYWVSDAYCFGIAYNGDYIKKNITSFWDVIDPEYDGRIVLRDITKSRTGSENYIGLRTKLPRSYFEELVKLHPMFVSGSEARHSTLASGEAWITIEGTPFDVYIYQQKGVNLKFVYPKEGVVLLPRPFVILNKTKHPNAAKLWVYFMTSEYGQEVYVKYRGALSGLRGFKSPNPEIFPAISDIKVINIDLTSITENQIEQTRNEFREIFGS